MASSSTADRLFQEAEAKASSAGKGGGFFSFGSSKAEKYEEAADLFRDAANAYRAIRDLTKSGYAFERSADIHTRHLSDPNEAAKQLVDAYKSYKDASPPDAIRCLRAAIDGFVARGNFRRGADLMSELGDLYDAQGDKQNALSSLETAVTWYNDEGIQATANRARVKAGQIAAEMEQYFKARDIFVQAADGALKSGPTGRFSVKGHLFKAGLCQLATGDLIGMRKCFDDWVSLDRGFLNEREGRFLHDLTESIEAKDADKFAQLSAQFDQMTKMEDWQITVLLAAKKFSEGPEIGEEDDEFA